jgi:hypothetical protein
MVRISLAVAVLRQLVEKRMAPIPGEFLRSALFCASSRIFHFTDQKPHPVPSIAYPSMPSMAV